MTREFGVQSEVGRLRQAIVHRPGLELARLTPSNCDELLFDDVLWASRAREEHDTFAQLLATTTSQPITSTNCSHEQWKFRRRARSCSIARAAPVPEDEL